MYFKADFSFEPTINYAPVKIGFKNLSVAGNPVDDGYTVLVDNLGNVLNLTVDITTLQTIISTYEWKFGDGTLSTDPSPDKTYELSGDYDVTLNIYSQEFFDFTSSKTYRVKNTIQKTVNIGLTTYAWFLQHMIAPQKESVENNVGFQELVYTSAQFFDRIYKDIHDIVNLVDFNKIPSEFLQYWSDTLNHQRFYAQRIGYSEQTAQGFLDYNFFDRVEAGTVTDDEVKYFRQFLLDTAILFKKNGSQEAIESFFKLYDFTISLKELWTKNFGVEFPKAIVDEFLFISRIEDTESKFKYNGINVGGWDNSLGHLEKTINELVIDNYHYVSHLVYPADATDASDTCYTQFFVNDFIPKIDKILRADGRDITDKEDCGSNTVESVCTTGTTGTSGTCTETGVSVIKNPSWDGASNEIDGILYKFYGAPTGYVQQVINIFGYLPNGVDEIDEGSGNGDTSDDYLWADWKTGVTVPPQIIGVKGLNRPTVVDNLPFVNYTTSITNGNLIQVADFPMKTTNDFFIVARGFIRVIKEGYYVFTYDIGNTGTISSSESVGLFSLKHTTPYTDNDLKYIDSLDDITFIRDNTDVTITVGTTATGTFNLYSKAGEYGVIEIRQGEGATESGTYHLVPGNYAFEIKSTYSSNFFKKLNLLWEAFEIQETESTIYFNKFINKSTIPSNSYITLNDTESTIADTEGKGILIVPNTLLEGSDTLSVVYKESNLDKNGVSGILSSDVQWKNLDITVRWAYAKPSDYAENTIIPSKSIEIVFRAVYRNKDVYSTVDDYYAVVVDGNKSTIKLVNVTYSKENYAYYYRYLNLNPLLNEKDKQVYETTIIDEFGHTFKFDENSYYDVIVSVVDNLVSVKFRKNVAWTKLKNDIPGAIAVVDYTDAQDYIDVFTNVKLDQTNNDTQIYGLDGNVVNVAENYIPIIEEGFYGFGVKTSIVRLISYIVEPKDHTDITLVRTEEKWKTIKAHYLDSRDSTLLKFNSYDENDPTTKNTFDYEITPSYNGQTSYDISQFENIDDNSIEKVFFNKVSTDSISTRFNIWLDDQFVANTFKDDADLISKVLIPLGHVYEPFINWIPVDSSTSYDITNHASLNRVIASDARILPHTVALSGSTQISFSEMIRVKDMLYPNNVCSQLLNSDGNVHLIGVWEEICPQSNQDVWSFNGSTGVATGSNEVLSIIYRDKTTQEEAIGVKFKSNDVIKDLICRYCVDTMIFGLFDVTLPSYAVKNYNKDWYWEPEETTTLRYFIPIGKLEEGSVYCLPSLEILRNPQVKINLLGVYAPHSFEGFQFTENRTLQILEQNKWDIQLNGRITSRYFLDLNADLAYSVEKPFGSTYGCDFNICPVKASQPWKTRETCTINNVWYLPEKVQSLVGVLEGYATFTDDYNWWINSEFYIKETFNTVLPPNDGINLFTGTNAPSAEFVHLIKDNDYNQALYNADITWCISSVSVDEEWATNNNSYGVGVFDVSAYEKIGFSTGASISGEKLIPTSFYMHINMPIDVVDISGDKVLDLTFFLNKETGERTTSPYGLYNWYLTHSNLGSIQEREKAGWDVSDWNDEFTKCFKINYVYWKPDTKNIKVNKYLTYTTEIPPFGSVLYITIDKDKTECINTTDRKVFGVSDGYNFIWAIPALYEKYTAWYNSGIKTYADGWEIPSDYYYVRGNVTNE